MNVLSEYITSNKTTIREAMEKLNIGNKILFIVDAENRLVGAISDGDIRRWILAGKSIDVSVVEAMNTEPKSVRKEEKEKAESYFKNLKLFAVPIVDNEKKIVNVILWDGVAKEEESKNLNIPVVIMAGGKGERLMPYTSIVPKPLIPIDGKPISELVIESFNKYGCKEFYFTLNYKKNMIKAYYDDLKKDYQVKYVEEDEPLGTGGSLYYIKDVLKKTFFVSNCDILLKVDYADVLEFHRKSNNIITVVTSLKRFTIPYGTVNLDREGRISHLAEKPSNDYLVNTGVYVLEPEIFKYLDEKKKIHLTDIVEMSIRDGLNVGTYPISEDAWLDMGQFEEMERMKAKL